jgi:hypothetical protein
MFVCRCSVFIMESGDEDMSAEYLAEWCASRGGGGVGQSGLGATRINTSSGTGGAIPRYYTSSSSYPSSSSGSYVCTICARQGHSMEQCTFSDTSAPISCFWCGSGDHHFTQCLRFKPSQQAITGKPYKHLADRYSCANCGRKDHLALHCPDPPCHELIDHRVFNGATISNRFDDRCHKCRQQGHTKSVCDKFRQYVTETGSRYR